MTDGLRTTSHKKLGEICCRTHIPLDCSSVVTKRDGSLHVCATACFADAFLPLTPTAGTLGAAIRGEHAIPS